MNHDETSKQQQNLFERVLSAWRPRDRDGVILGHPAWFDLDDGDREAAFEATLRARQLEAAMDPRGLSSTGKAVLRRIQGAGHEEL